MSRLIFLPPTPTLPGVGGEEDLLLWDQFAFMQCHKLDSSIVEYVSIIKASCYNKPPLILSALTRWKFSLTQSPLQVFRLGGSGQSPTDNADTQAPLTRSSAILWLQVAQVSSFRGQGEGERMEGHTLHISLSWLRSNTSFLLIALCQELVIWFHPQAKRGC